MAGNGMGWASLGSSNAGWDNNPWKHFDGRPQIHAVIGGIEGNVATVFPDGGLKVNQDDLLNTFSGILKELKKINIHLSILTDMPVTNLDVEGF